MGFLLIVSVVAVEAYLRGAEKSDLEELLAAEALADIAMALTYAQFHHITPEQHNWSDPEFIQNNLMAILPSNSASGMHLNSVGCFSNCGYILRVYTSNDLSRFLIVAHPTPSWFQWLISKAAILVDSSSMELKKIRDLKSLNRMLTNLNTFDGINVALISDLINAADTIQLAHLARALKKPEFQPPRALQFLRPGAQNLIYNAPRYHVFDDALLKKTSQFVSMHTSSHEQSMLKAELEFLKQLPNLVLYTVDSVASSKESIAALKIIAPDMKFMLATLKYDSSGQLKSTKIVIDSEKQEEKETKIVAGKKPEAPFVKKAVALPRPIPIASDLGYGEPIALEEPPKEQKSFLKQLQRLAVKRQRVLDSLYQKGDFVTRAYLEGGKKKVFSKELAKLLARRKKLDVKTKEALFEIVFEHEDVDSQAANNYIRDVGLEELWKEVAREK